MSLSSLAMTEAVAASLRASLAAAERFEVPYRHFMVSDVFPAEVAGVLRRLPFEAAGVDGVSGKRELHNDTRRYFDAETCERFAACRAIGEAFQSAAVVGSVEGLTGASVAGSYVRLEYAQDIDGFWLQPHTDLGVKTFTMLIYLSEDSGQLDLGTDIYADRETWAKRTAFVDNTALIFVPAANTWHGLERRPIRGVRKSVIMNYVTDDWRERSQLTYPDRPVRA
ncbi:MAG: hypothetical protein ACYC8V_08255 [Caulobacteraceae bacterium]